MNQALAEKNQAMNQALAEKDALIRKLQAQIQK
jgi:hypothetical protein